MTVGEGPRTRSAQLIVDKLGELSAGGPVILVGDLNAGQSVNQHGSSN
jgi:endonuclease/exonuclease/phosphatase family metal-dependent hydrolase